MTRFIHVFVLFLIIASGTNVYGQFRAEEEPISAGWQLGIQQTTRGWGASLHYLRGSDDMQLLFGVDMNVIKDPREIQTEPFFGQQGRDYVFGKLNNFAALSPVIGVQKNIVSIGNGNLLNLRVGGLLGPTIGILNPYQLEIFAPIAGRPQLGDRVVEPYDPTRHNYSSIIGRASIFDSDFIPSTQFGLSAKVYGLIDFSNNSNAIKAVQLGVNANWFASPVPIMADFVEVSNNQLFMAVSVGLLLGNRW